jgi:hypothetical protein
MNLDHQAREALKTFTARSTPYYREGSMKPIGKMGDHVKREPHVSAPGACAHGADARTCYGCTREALARSPISRF